MFRPDEIQARLREQPFRPLRIIVTEGLRYDIHHPNLVMVGLRDIMIGHERPARPGIYDRITRVALINIVGIEDIPMGSVSQNGAAD